MRITATSGLFFGLTLLLDACSGSSKTPPPDGSTTTDASSVDASGDAAAQSHLVRGTLTLRNGGPVVLQNDGGDDLMLSADGTFAFATALADGQPYAVTVLTPPAGQTCTVTNGTGSVSGADVTNVDVLCAPFGQVAFTTPGSTTWTVPAGVTSVSVVVVGGGGAGYAASNGGGGGGGALCYANDIAVTPGAMVPVVVGSGGVQPGLGAGSPGTASSFDGTLIANGGGGTKDSTGGAGGTGSGGTCFAGGAGGSGTGTAGTARSTGGGGGAAGYAGNGGAGGSGGATCPSATAGTGGGGGGGGSGFYDNTCTVLAGGGGGVGLLGRGADGAPGGSVCPNCVATGPNTNGTGGSSGTTANADGGNFGGGSGGGAIDTGGNGGVRILWGLGRAYPATNTLDM